MESVVLLISRVILDLSVVFLLAFLIGEGDNGGNGLTTVLLLSRSISDESLLKMFIFDRSGREAFIGDELHALPSDYSMSESDCALLICLLFLSWLQTPFCFCGLADCTLFLCLLVSQPTPTPGHWNPRKPPCKPTLDLSTSRTLWDNVPAPPNPTP